MGGNVDTCAIWSAGVDWVTMTWKPDWIDSWTRAEALADLLIQQRQAQGHKAKCARLRDYEGTQCEGIFTGGRADGYIIQASGEAGDQFARLCIANGCEGNVTRLDLHATIKFKHDWQERATQVYRQIAAAKQEGTWPQKIRLDLVESCGRGDSISIGTRVSDCFRRVYDKTRQQSGKIECNLWRWEIEFKGDRARETWEAIMQAESTVSIARNIVAAEFSRIGLYHPWMKHTALIKRPSSYHATDDEKSITWLQNQVRPVVKRLRDAGKTEEMLDALALLCEHEG